MRTAMEMKMKASQKFNRRVVLRGMLGGSAVSVGIPILECMLNQSGSALAATGEALPPCFGTFFWAHGLAFGQWTPAVAGKDYALPAHLANLQPIKAKMNLFSGMQ